MTIKLINVGRNKVNKIAEIDTTKGLYHDSIEETIAGVCGHYLMSHEISAVLNEKTSLYDIFAGFHKVGEVEIIGNYISSQSGQVLQFESKKNLN